MKKIVVILFLFLNIQVFAQDTSKVKIETCVDVVSSLLWRGSISCNNPNISPYIITTYNNFELTVWGSSDFLGTYREIDFTLIYNIKNLKLSLSDYDWYLNQNYFDFDNKTTGHIIEYGMIYKISEKFPLTLSGYTFIYGKDKEYDTISLNPKNNYSTYFEASYLFKKMNIFIGATPFDGYFGDSYGNKGGFAFCNIGISTKKEFIIKKDLTIPLKSVLCVNPQAKNIYFTIGITL